MITRINKPDDRKLNSNQTYNISLWVKKKQTKNHACEKIMFGILVHVLVSVMSMCIARLVKIQNTAIV